MGTVLGVHDAIGAQTKALDVIRQAGEYVLMTAFSFDRQDVVDELVAAKKRGIDIKLAVDKKMSLSGTTRDQLKSLKTLVAHGVRVHACQGTPYGAEYRAVGRNPVGGRGIQHSKTVMSEVEVLIGSTNFTTASRANIEVNVHVKLSREEHEKLKARLMKVFEEGAGLSEAEIEAAQKSRSASPVRARRQGF